MKSDQVAAFAQELNALTRKYRVMIREKSGPLLLLKDAPYGTSYSGHSPEIAKKNDRDEWVISEPWGG